MPHKYDLYLLAVNPSQRERISGLVGVVHNFSQFRNGSDQDYLVVSSEAFSKIMGSIEHWMAEGEGFSAYHSKRDDLPKVLPAKVFSSFCEYVRKLDESLVVDASLDRSGAVPVR